MIPRHLMIGIAAMLAVALGNEFLRLAHAGPGGPSRAARRIRSSGLGPSRDPRNK